MINSAVSGGAFPWLNCPERTRALEAIGGIYIILATAKRNTGESLRK